MKRKLLLIAIVSLLFGCSIPRDKTYKVMVTFCDERKPKIVTVEQITPPSNRDINTWKVAVPQWNGYLNVCDIEILDEK